MVETRHALSLLGPGRGRGEHFQRTGVECRSGFFPYTCQSPGKKPGYSKEIRFFKNTAKRDKELFTSPSKMTAVIKDEQLMLRVAEGDLEAFGEIVRRHQRMAWRVAHRFLGDPVEAGDVVQDAFLRILTAAPRYKPTAAFSTYLYRVVARLCIDNARKKRPVLSGKLSELAAFSPDPETALILKDRDTLVRKALDTLPPRQRMAVILKYYEDLSYSEIALAMKTTVKAVERLLGRARRALKSGLMAS